MSAWKAAVAGAVGFAVGAGAMLMPGNQKMKKQVQKQVDKLSKMAKMWKAGQGQCPCTPDCAPWARRGVGGHEAWPWFYRRGTTGATARRFDRAMHCTPDCVPWARRGVGDMKLGRALPP